MVRFTSLAGAALALASLSSAQTFTDCDPTKRSDCPTRPGLQEEYFVDFTKGSAGAGNWRTTSGTIGYTADGAEFSIKKLGDGPTIQSDFYIFFGYVEVKLKAAPGAGIVSSAVIQSDNLDEIDWEWIGSDPERAQSNYFGKGNVTTYDRGAFHAVSATTSTFHTYAIDWNKDTTKFLIDGNVVRTLNYADANGGKNYPQTPSNIRIGNWVGGSPGNSPGTIQWAGGLADFSKAPFNMYVQSIKVKNYNPASSYSYGDFSGSFESIKLLDTPATSGNSVVKNGTSDSGSGSGSGPSSNSPKATITINGGGQGNGVIGAKPTASTKCKSGDKNGDRNGGDKKHHGTTLATTVSINTGAVVTGAANNTGLGLVASAPGNNSQTTYSIKVGSSATSAGIALATDSASITSFFLSGSATPTRTPLQVTVSGGIRQSSSSLLGLVVLTLTLLVIA